MEKVCITKSTLHERQKEEKEHRTRQEEETQRNQTLWCGVEWRPPTGGSSQQAADGALHSRGAVATRQRSELATCFSLPMTGRPRSNCLVRTATRAPSSSHRRQRAARAI